MKIDGQKVRLVKVNQTTLIKLADMGVALDDLSGRDAVAFAVGMLALSLGCSVKEAEQHIKSHIAGGNDITPFIDACTRSVGKWLKTKNLM